MFTGLIQRLGTLTWLSPSRLQIECQALNTRIEIGDSIAVDGLCLTVTEVLPQGFCADVSPETLNRSTLGKPTSGNWVNLEPSLRVGDKIGGHFVSGHIDGVGQFLAQQASGEAWILTFRVPESIGRYLVQKGSVAINGVSLTLSDLREEGNWFQVAVIPHTYHSTNLCRLQPLDNVNVETDMLGKYVEKFLRTGIAPAHAVDSLSLEFLAEHGYT
ncbi:MAG: riboflavin synthase [Synechococcaceae cyanobacterium SM2_3_1]|nr:riboflavin synthase [Synechococcaceae cyanobacterium SM2_3_1]